MDDHTVLPDPFSAQLVDGVALLPLAPTGLTWCWRIAVGGEGYPPRFVAVPDSAAIIPANTLVDVDPATFAPNPDA